MNEIIKATKTVRLIKQLLEKNQKLLAVQAIIVIYDTNLIDANNFVKLLGTE